MSSGKLYKVYRYYQPATGMSYVGRTSTSLNQRAGKDGNNYKECHKFWDAIQQYGFNSFEREILEVTDNLEKSYKLEEKYINLCNSINNGYNNSAGQGARGIIMSSKTRERMSNSKKGHIVSNETRKKIAFSLSKKKVQQYSLDGNFLNQYSSLMEAAKGSGASFSNIRQVCIGNRKTAGGYIWKYAE